ncbi:hypothetical protein V7O66_07255 [Methanolobus sp. ZRKC3]|uniref:DUF7284 family protein n=1 Tax=Methanolobus sp. ZRKC3 TaxID=3125786 RepID=UPI00324C462D
MYRKYTDNEDAFSTTLDAIFFLVLISISAVILLPNLAAEDQYTSSGYICAQEMDNHLLSSILSSKTDEFEYTFKPAELAGYNLSIPENSMVGNAEKTLYKREQKHRSFADIVAESLVLGLEIKSNANHIALNPMTEEHRVKTKVSIQEYIDSEIGGRYKYRLEAHWHPVKGYIGSDIVIGDTAPQDAIRQSAKISLPLDPIFSRKDVFASMNDSIFQEALLSDNPEQELHKSFNNIIGITSAYAAETVTSIAFPADYLRTLDNTEIGSNSEQVSLIASPDENIQKPELMIALKVINYTLNDVYRLNFTVPEANESITTGLIDNIEAGIIDSNRKNIASHIEHEMSAEINQSVSMILNETENSRSREIRDQQLDSLCRNFDTGGAEIILFLWQ